jgi:hypothetical protein
MGRSPFGRLPYRGRRFTGAPCNDGSPEGAGAPCQGQSNGIGDDLLNKTEEDPRLNIVLVMHFNYDLSKENLKCENCQHFVYDLCRGKSYKHKKVKECMKKHAKNIFTDELMTCKHY